MLLHARAGTVNFTRREDNAVLGHKTCTAPPDTLLLLRVNIVECRKFFFLSFLKYKFDGSGPYTIDKASIKVSGTMSHYGQYMF